MMVALPLILVFLLPLAQSEVKYKNQAYSNIETYPYLASIEGDRDFTKCAAAIINSFYVLTSASCVDGAPLNELKVRAGADYKVHDNDDYDTDSDQIIIIRSNIYQIIPALNHSYPYYDNGVILAVQPPLLMDQPEGVTVAHVNFPRLDGAQLKIGGEATVVGWDFNIGLILTSKVEIVDLEKCAKTYKMPEKIKDKTICVGSRECSVTVDQAVEASLLVQDGVLYGIYSHGSACPTLEYPAVFTKMPSV